MNKLTAIVRRGIRSDGVSPEPSRTGRSLHRSELANLALMLIAGVATLALLLTIGSYSVQQRENHDRGLCLTRWADKYTARADIITAANNTLSNATVARNHAQDKLFGEIRQQVPPLTKQQALAAFDVYLQASKVYDQAVSANQTAQKDNPIPPSPQLSC